MGLGGEWAPPAVVASQLEMTLRKHDWPEPGVPANHPVPATVLAWLMNHPAAINLVNRVP
ncbi:hypothetical protein V3C33_15395 [Micrococcaceae bacterium Sec5.7]